MELELISVLGVSFYKFYKSGAYPTSCLDIPPPVACVAPTCGVYPLTQILLYLGKVYEFCEDDYNKVTASGVSTWTEMVQSGPRLAVI